MFKKASHKCFLTITSSLVLLCGYAEDEQAAPAHSGPVMNYHRVNDRLATGGHLLDGGTAALQGQGIEVVIDLRDEPPSGQKKRFAEHGIEWTNIPVKWSAPTKANFDRFSKFMLKHQGDHVLVQCAANYRASTMTYLYRVLVKGIPEEKARKDLDAVWNPSENEIWRAFIDNVKSAHDTTDSRKTS